MLLLLPPLLPYPPSSLDTPQTVPMRHPIHHRPAGECCLCLPPQERLRLQVKMMHVGAKLQLQQPQSLG